MAATQLTMTNWFSAYLIWFVPLALAALFACYRTAESSSVAPERWGRRRAPSGACRQDCGGVARLRLAMVFPWYTLFALLFLIPFVDPRRPFRLLHLDLLVLLVTGVGPLLAELGAGQPRGSLALTVLGLSYLAVRFLLLGFRPARAREPLVPLLTARWLMVALVLVLGLRFGYVLAERTRPTGGSRPSRARTGSGRGRSSMTRIWTRRCGSTPTPTARPPISSTSRSSRHSPGRARKQVTPRSPSMSSSSLVCSCWGGGFDRDRRRLLGIALGYAWATYPYTLFEIQHGINDAVVACLVVATYLAVPSAAGRGACGAGSRHQVRAGHPGSPAGNRERRAADALLGPVFHRIRGGARAGRDPTAAGWVQKFWDRTLGFQLDRGGYSVWAHLTNPDWLRTIAQVSVAALALLLALVPRRRSLWQLTALGAGIMAALQLTMNNWSDGYLLWLAPLALAACFAAHDCRPEAAFGLGERGKAGAASAEIPASPAEEVVRV